MPAASRRARLRSAATASRTTGTTGPRAAPSPKGAGRSSCSSRVRPRCPNRKCCSGNTPAASTTSSFGPVRVPLFIWCGRRAIGLEISTASAIRTRKRRKTWMGSCCPRARPGARPGGATGTWRFTGPTTFTRARSAPTWPPSSSFRGSPGEHRRRCLGASTPLLPCFRAST